ncbi:MAG: riboflavin synthase [Acidimicrobiales bacterium]
MFTGLVEELGRFVGRDGGRFRFASTVVIQDADVGASIAVNGACLTVVARGAGWWEADVVDETLARTTLGDLAEGDGVNLERPVRPADRLGGHIVQGHVDVVAEVVSRAPDLEVRVPGGDGLRYVARKGSVAVDGVSLTVLDVRGGSFTVAVIPHTAEVTTLGRRRPGDRVNVEFDVLAKYVERLLGE